MGVIFLSLLLSSLSSSGQVCQPFNWPWAGSESLLDWGAQLGTDLLRALRRAEQRGKITPGLSCWWCSWCNPRNSPWNDQVSLFKTILQHEQRREIGVKRSLTTKASSWSKQTKSWKCPHEVPWWIIPKVNCLKKCKGIVGRGNLLTKL